MPPINQSEISDLGYHRLLVVLSFALIVSCDQPGFGIENYSS